LAKQGTTIMMCLGAAAVAFGGGYLFGLRRAPMERSTVEVDPDLGAESTQPRSEYTAHGAPSPARRRLMPHVVDAGPAAVASPQCSARPELVDRALNNLLTFMATEADAPMFRDGPPESVVENYDLWPTGFAAALALQPDSAVLPIREAIAARLCSATAPMSEVQTLTLVQLMRKERRLVSQESAQCVLRAATRESSVVAYTMDMITEAGLPHTQEWEDWRARATTRALRVRFESIDETGSVDPLRMRREPGEVRTRQ